MLIKKKNKSKLLKYNNIKAFKKLIKASEEYLKVYKF